MLFAQLPHLAGDKCLLDGDAAKLGDLLRLPGSAGLERLHRIHLGHAAGRGATTTKAAPGALGGLALLLSDLLLLALGLRDVANSERLLPDVFAVSHAGLLSLLMQVALERAD